jgi:hypothetical protein
MLDTKEYTHIRTGWVEWENISVILESSTHVIGEASVLNGSEHSTKCTIVVEFDNNAETQVHFDFWPCPLRKDKTRFAKELSRECWRITNVDVDEM